MIRGKENKFYNEMASFVDKLEVGDLILMAGTSTASKILVNVQKSYYKHARSSHVAIAQSDFICIDATPELGVAHRLISEVLSQAENNWRVIRFNGFDSGYESLIDKACAFYIEQPYRIFPKRKPSKKYSYCSELARKVYFDSDIKKTGIPKSSVVKPCDFDKLADAGVGWVDVTESLRPYVKFCVEYEDLLKVVSRYYQTGVQLNHHRAKERRAVRRAIKAASRKGVVTPSLSENILNDISKADMKMHYKFWDTE